MSPRGPQCVACSGTRRRPSRGLIDAIRRSHGEQVWPVRGHRDCTNLLRGNDVGRLPRFHCSQVRDESEISCRRRISHSPQTLATSSFPHLAKSAPCQSITEAFSQSIRKHSAHTRSGGRWNIGVNSRTAECEARLIVDTHEYHCRELVRSWHFACLLGSPGIVAAHSATFVVRTGRRSPHGCRSRQYLPLRDRCKQH